MTLIRRYILWLILATLAGIAGAWLVYASLPVRYVSTAQVEVEPLFSVLTITWTPNMGTEQQVATSGFVLTSAAQALHTTPAALKKDVAATVSGTAATGGAANVLAISCTMPTAVQAQSCATATTTAYMNFRNNISQEPLQVTLVSPATLPTAPAGPGKLILLPIGALLGLMLGIGAIFVRDHFDHRVRDRADLERLLDAPVLAAIPAVQHPQDIFRRKPLSQAAEAYRYLREHLNPLITSAPDGGAVVLVAGPQARERRTCVAANLAAALVEQGTSVILIDADLRHPSLSKVFHVGQRPGWYDLIAGKASLDEVAVPVPDAPGLRLVTAGTVLGPAGGIFADARLTQAFRDMREQAEVVVVDSSPVLEVSHAITLARASDIVAVVADTRHTAREAVSAAIRQIRVSGPRIIIGVLTGVSSHAYGQPPPGPAREPGSPVPASSVPEVLAGIVPPRGHNGHQRAQIGAGPTSPDAETDAGGPGSGDVPR